MRRNWRGRYKNNWYRGNNRRNVSSDNTSINDTNSSVLISSTSKSSRAPANQLPIVIPIYSEKNIWKLYFPTEDNASSTDFTENIKCFKEYIEKNRSLFDLEKIDQTRSVALDIQSLLSDADFCKKWTTFQVDLFEKPDTTLRILEYCFHETLKCEAKIKVRILNHEPIIPISNLKVNYFGKLVTIKGTVIRVGSVGLICNAMAFECTSCHSIQGVMQPQGIFTAPNFCQSCKNGHKFEPLQSSPFTNTTDWQVAKIQEIQAQSLSGTIPKTVEIELQGDLVGTACPGDVLSVTGIVQVRGESKGGEDGRRAARLLQLYVEAVSIHSQRNLSNPTLSFTLKDYYAIQEIHASEDVFRLLVHSLCPSIFGHEAVKAGLLLGLFGGTDHDTTTRSNPHILVVGDPGLGKSRLLQAAAHAAPRGVYVCGASSSAGGLTVSLGREAGGDFSLEAGALVLADQGVCCVDELDKMGAHHSSLLEAMEQRRVSVAKGGVVCSLAARATLLAAANPAAGAYNRAKTVSENLKLNSALLSRFDLVFILLDQPDEKIDAMLSEHVLALHSGSKNKRKHDGTSQLNTSINTSQTDSEVSLSTRLRLKPGELIDTLPVVLLRKYIAYARRYVHPKLSSEAANILKEFYLQLRSNHQSVYNDGAPITTRQLEACIRLTQARARVNLREEATAKDARDVISLVKHSLMDTYSDEFGNIQLSRSINGSGVSSRNKVKKFLDALTRRSHQLGKDVFTRQELIQIHKAAGVSGDASDLIESMHVHSYLLLKASNLYQLSLSGTIPKTVEIELQGDLVGTACPGDVLSVTGIVQVRGESKGGEDGRRAARLLQLYVEAVSIHSQRNLSNPTLSFTLKDYYAIQEIHASEDVFRLLVHSLCPSIFGHEAVKAGLLLGLFGGTDHDTTTRSNPHILVVGDPGLGKSRLLQAAAHAAPRGVYVCGASSSAGGLTVSLGREAGGDFSLEAGALVLADQGVCCVDELDKMGAHHSSLLEAMEQRRVSVAKGGVVCSLAARATLLAAANPAAGAYNRAKTVSENLKLNSALLSRFDLVFILLDQPDEKIDAMLSEHVLALHSGSKNKRKHDGTSQLNTSINTSQTDSEVSLSTRLRLKPGELIDTLPVVLLRKYIAYARRYVHPKLSSEAANILKEFYLQLRSNHQSVYNDGAPITTRQLEACIRLTQARARVNLREEATAKDARDVISLVKHSLMDTYSDEFGNIQLSRSINGSGVSSRNKVKKFLDALTRRSHQLGKDVFTRQELIQIHKAAGVSGDASDLIESMHVHSYLLLKASNLYQLVAI